MAKSVLLQWQGKYYFDGKESTTSMAKKVLHVRHYYEMKQMAAYKDCLSKQLSNEAKRIKEKLNE